MADPKKPRRDDLAKIFKDQRILRAFEKIFDYIPDSIITVEADITSIEGDITSIEADITSIEGDITSIEADITSIEGDITSLQNTLAALELGDLANVNLSSPAKWQSLKYNGTNWFNSGNRFGAVTTKTTDYTATENDSTILVDATAGDVDITLPAVANVTGLILTIKMIDSSGNTVSVIPNGAEKIDGAASVSTTTQYDFWTLQSDGSNWYLIN